MEIQVFAMAYAPNGDALLASQTGKEPAFYDVILSTLPDANGDIDVLEEHESLTLDQASEIAIRLEATYPDAGLTWVD